MALGGCASEDEREPIAFPGAVGEVKLGSGSLWLVNEYARTEDEAQDPRAHSLYIEDRATGIRIRIHEYNRHVTVLPSPSGRAVAVTDYEGSNASTCLVFVLVKEVERTDLRNRVEASSLGKLLPPANSHVYIEAVRWEGEGELRFLVRGYGDANPAGFNVQAAYSIGDRAVSALDK